MQAHAHAHTRTRTRTRTHTRAHTHTHTHTHTHRQGVLLPAEQQSLPLLLTRLGRTHSLFSHPHPLSKCQGHTTSSDVLDTSSDSGERVGETAIMSLDDFHSSFLHYCICNGFASLLYHYMDCYRYM